MAECTKAILNNNNAIGLVWKSNGKEVVILNKESKIDMDFGLTVIDTKTNEKEYVDLIDVITEALNKLNEEDEK